MEVEKGWGKGGNETMEVEKGWKKGGNKTNDVKAPEMEWKRSGKEVGKGWKEGGITWKRWQYRGNT